MSPAHGPPAVRFLREAGQGLAALLAALVGTLAYLRARPRRRPAPRLGLAGAWEAIALALLVVGLVAAAMILVDPAIPGLRLRLPRGLVELADRLTDLGLGTVILWPLGLALLYVLALQPRLDAFGRRVAASLVARLGFLFLSIATVGLSVAIAKHLLGRARPQAAFFLPGPHAQLTFDWLAWKSNFASFPSGHSTTVFATAIAFAALYPRARGWLIALAAVVASTRVVLGSHYPSDVIAGAALGTAFVLVMVKVFAARRVVFAVAADGRIAPMAGPSARRLGKVLFPRAPGASNGASGGASLEEARS
ncbi:phosphatase PAP2 family protein [Xanthobacter sp. KR7-225]|uniref:phosphatase PAP2 family protein n=1 Tax=Xanthobacter sp. KR7-225 TaxID=3156613 RepID=UPI0032B5CE74